MRDLLRLEALRDLLEIEYRRSDLTDSERVYLYEARRAVHSRTCATVRELELVK